MLASFAALLPSLALEGQTGAGRPPALAQTSFYNEVAATPETSYNESISLNGGTLSWIATYSSGTCGEHGTGTYSMYEYSNFVYSYQFPSAFYTNPQEYVPVSVNLIGQVGYIYNSTQSPPYCPPNGSEPAGGAPMMDANDFYRVDFTPTANGLGTATMETFTTGGVLPQYVVMSVVYAPPGPGGTSTKSSVNYTKTTELGTNTTWASSFTNEESYTTTASLLGVTGILLGASESGGAGWTQETDNSQSIAINQTSSLSDIYSGLEPANVAGLDHDNDIVLVWLNAAMDCVAEPAWTVIAAPAAAECVIYDPMMAPGDPDNPLPDIVQLPVGELNGDYSLEALNPDTYQILQNHGITSAEFLTIAQNDPYYACGASISCVQTIGTVIGSNYQRFDLQTNADIIDFGNNGGSTIYPVVYQATSTLGEAASYSYSITNSFTGSEAFIGNMSELLKTTQTWTNKWASTTTTMVGQSATATVAEPLSGYDGPSQFEVYKDNVYGTFMFYPTQ